MKHILILITAFLFIGSDCALEQRILSVPQIIPGETRVKAIVDENTIGFYDASRKTLFVDEENKERVLTAMNAELQDDNRYSIMRGKPFIAQAANLPIKIIRPFKELNLNTRLGLNDAKTVYGFLCTLEKPGSCYNKLESTEPNANIKFSFDVPSYGMSGCIEVENVLEECVSWLAKETVTKYSEEDCKGTKTTEEVECLVCSLP